MSEAAESGRVGEESWSVEPGAEHEARFRAERLQLARDLHDVVASGFAVVSLQASLAAHTLANSPERALEALAEIRRTSSEALGELQAILGILRAADSVGADGTPGVVRIVTLASVTTAAGVPTSLTVTGRERPLPVQVDLAAYRIAQESLTNVLRHSGATSAAVLLAYEDDRLVVEIEDDGVGGSDSGGPGHGILGMRERAAALGGDLETEARPEGGFLVRATLPCGAL